ncbi:MAG: lysine--tRNA ligase [Clostridiales bacterium]|nr:lysine--tRNA ligase [Clostridiales bacterium]
MSEQKNMNNNVAPETDALDEQENTDALRAVRLAKLDELCKAGNDPFTETSFEVTAHAQEITSAPEEGKTVALAGRLMSKRIMGKASFGHMLDRSGKIQIYVKSDTLGLEKYDGFKKQIDIGDIIGVVGEVFITHRGEVSVAVRELTLLSKSLLPLPEKWHGLKDNDLRYRKRYLDLIVNDEVKDTFIKRSKIISAVRSYLDADGFLEVETPILNTVAGGAAARPFITHHNTLDLDMFMRIAPELYLKRLMVGGLERVYEIGRCFRNEGMDIKHNPEFTMMELYQAYGDYTDMMKRTEDIYRSAAHAIGLGDKITYQGKEIDISTPWRRVTMRDIVKETVGVDFMELSDDAAMRELTSRGIEFEGKKNAAECMYIAFDKLVEATLIQPTFVTGYPIEVSPLAKRNADGLTYRFEFFINGWEGGNAYSELNDPLDQAKRFEAQRAMMRQGNEEAQQSDDDFVEALEYGMPPTGGLGIGIDRMVMLLTDSASIRDVILFPTMKPRKK